MKITKMDIPVNAEVRCGDAISGRSTYVILNPTTREVTHVVVREEEWPNTERLVPVDLIAESTPYLLRLRCKPEELARFEPFVETEYVQEGVSHEQYVVGEYFLWPSYHFSGESVVPVEHEHVPPGEMAIHRGAHVEATDGRVGRVDEFLVNAKTKRITHLVLRQGHPWDKQDVFVPFSKIDRMEEDTIYLKLDKNSVAALPAIPVLL